MSRTLFVLTCITGIGALSVGCPKNIYSVELDNFSGFCITNFVFKQSCAKQYTEGIDLHNSNALAHVAPGEYDFRATFEKGQVVECIGVDVTFSNLRLTFENHAKSDIYCTVGYLLDAPRDVKAP